ncbi:YgaP family membrane protein [Thiorhodovibrio frisius]|uniref:Inner membrane protein YgaP-like transmembrane domain-containing protein n=1 Tax=Thiorhodovibrio frisius TaxID=631362 RepID=H8Z8E8_9GAMM|nr:DUF2892 domain-containing protein [Thiorhodovibrio frisius]EIC19353.1 Protein of unknown function (DUF2892) [Thiorhodovibrio frisius]WPL22348.1 hypothetical protein Thiofri_02508 [Thiorhodovibrio frisius]
MNFTQNVGELDRNIRFILGGALIVADLLNRELGLFTLCGALLMGTAYMRTCLAYVPLNINTMKEGEGKDEGKTEKK